MAGTDTKPSTLDGVDRALKIEAHHLVKVIRDLNGDAVMATWARIDFLLDTRLAIMGVG